MNKQRTISLKRPVNIVERVQKISLRLIQINTNLGKQKLVKKIVRKTERFPELFTIYLIKFCFRPKNQVVRMVLSNFLIKLYYFIETRFA